MSIKLFFNKKRYKKTEFHADFESIEKVVKQCTKKSYKQNMFDDVLLPENLRAHLQLSV